MAGDHPRKGDFVTLEFETRAGHEQRGRRPALVISNDLFNERTGLAIVCPLTRTRRGYPFHVEVPPGGRTTGFVMTEQVRSIDWRARGAKRIGPAPQDLLDEVLSILDACLYQGSDTR